VSRSADPGQPESHSARLDRIRAKAPLFLEMAVAAIRKGKTEDHLARMARAARVGEDDGVRENRDLGPGIRLRPVRGRAAGHRGSVVLRDADTVLEDGPDPARPAHNVRRARRIDPLLLLRKCGSITVRMHDAAERLRETLEGAEPSIAPTGSASISVAAHQREAMADRQVENRTRARKAFASIDRVNHVAVLWLVVGGSIAGLSRISRTRDETISARLREGLEQLAAHYYGR
jgi:hypothetical protein